jgi:hypothetical protein
MLLYLICDKIIKFQYFILYLQVFLTRDILAFVSYLRHYSSKIPSEFSSY